MARNGHLDFSLYFKSKINTAWITPCLDSEGCHWADKFSSVKRSVLGDLPLTLETRAASLNQV